MVLLAARAGQLFNLSGIGKECGISQATAKDWLMALQATSLIYLIIKKGELLNLRIHPVPFGNGIVTKHWNDEGTS